MSYRINRTDGELLIDLTDGIIDTTTTDLTLIGKNYKGFGEPFNENFVKLLENFASTSQPANPMVGQIWFDKQDTRLKVYDGVTFRAASGSIVSSTQPGNLTTGDIWIDNLNNKLYLFDGTDLVLVGPTYSAGQGKTGFETASQLDSTDVQRTILKLFLGGTLVGVYSPETFIIPNDFAIPGLSADPNDTFTPKRQKLFKGFNIANLEGETATSGFWWRGTAEKAKKLIDDAGNERGSENFLPTDANGATTGSLRIKNSAGLSVGVGDTEFGILKVSGTTTILETQQSNADLAVRVRTGSSFLNAFYADASEQRVGIFTTNPSATLDVSGDVKVQGSLTVNGDSTFINASTLRVEDKNIELGLLDDSTEGNDSAIDDGGIILRSSDGSKDFTWKQSTSSWTSNQDIDINDDTKGYKIAGSTILSKTALASSVTSAPGLTSFGTLAELTVDNVKIDGQTISRVGGAGLIIDANGDTSLANNKITDLATPTGSADAATKNYVDVQLNAQSLLVPLDVTGLTDPDDILTNDGPYTSIRNILELLRAASSTESGTVAKVLATSYSNSTVSGIGVTISTSPDSSGVLQKAVVSVRDAADTGSESVIQDIAASNTASGSVSLTATRYIYEYTNVAGTWTYTLGTRTQVTVT
tara:strand:- start:7591 stop:9525 length:1935 start_codon:yes stop_codon:yes gene_type:complete